MESVTIFVFLILVGSLVLFFSEEDPRAKLEARLAAAGGVEETPIQSVTDQELERSFFDRVIKPILDLISRKEEDSKKKKKDTGVAAEIRKLLGQAGLHGKLSADQFITLHIIFAVFMSVSGVLLTLLVLKLKGQSMLFGILIPAILGYLGPKMVLINKAKARLFQIQKTLPDTLDLLVVAVDAGLGFDQAISKVCEKMKGPIPDEFKIVLKQTQMGLSRKDALREMAQRIDHPDLSSFCGAIIQAAELGVGIGQVLRVQSDQMKQKKKQRAEEAANKVPVIMMVPMVFFIFPTVFVVILAPAVFQIYVDLIAR